MSKLKALALALVLVFAAMVAAPTMADNTMGGKMAPMGKMAPKRPRRSVHARHIRQEERHRGACQGSHAKSRR